MTDGESIVQLMHLYAFAIDAKQMQLFDQIFTPDVEADYTGRHWNDRASWQKDFEASHQPFDVTQHLVLNVNWHVSGDTGRAFSQSLFRLIRRGCPGGDMVSGGAWYDDELRRTPDGWRISKRISRATWMSGNAAVIRLHDMTTYPLTSMSEGVKNGTINFLNGLDSPEPVLR
jgi:SnoaL-like domain